MRMGRKFLYQLDAKFQDRKKLFYFNSWIASCSLLGLKASSSSLETVFTNHTYSHLRYLRTCFAFHVRPSQCFSETSQNPYELSLLGQSPGVKSWPFVHHFEEEAFRQLWNRSNPSLCLIRQTWLWTVGFEGLNQCGLIFSCQSVWSKTSHKMRILINEKAQGNMLGDQGNMCLKSPNESWNTRLFVRLFATNHTQRSPQGNCPTQILQFWHELTRSYRTQMANYVLHTPVTIFLALFILNNLHLCIPIWLSAVLDI